MPTGLVTHGLFMRDTTEPNLSRRNPQHPRMTKV